MRSDIATLREISNQPSVWTKCFESIDLALAKDLTKGFMGEDVEWLFIGCGTSFYLAQAAAYSFGSLLGVRARAIPASEVLLFPSIQIQEGSRRQFPILISRSGHTSEVIQVAEALTSKGLEFMAVTCDGRELESMTPRLLKLPVTEESTVMTSSFTGMLLGLQSIAATLAGDDAFLYALQTLPAELDRLLLANAGAVEQFAKLPVDNIAVLGQGVLYPIASESALKVMESSSTYAQFFHTLEFRHGPKSIVGRDVLVAALISESGFDWEVPVIREMKDLGATTMIVANSISRELRSNMDLAIELQLPVPELARAAIYVVWGQLLGSYRGLAKGLNPDHPQNLSRVVTI
jgi:glucosamine--fructose-6-phosphate aminotransferase (isomerizing)